MKNLDRKVTLLCPLCGNDLFSCEIQGIDSLVDAPDTTPFRCADCGSVYTKRELIDGNTEVLENAQQEMMEDALEETLRELEYVLSHLGKENFAPEGRKEEG